jgi:hypothetical protein
MAPIRGELERIAAILAAARADERTRVRAEAVFGRKPQSASDAPTAPPLEPEA